MSEPYVVRGLHHVGIPVTDMAAGKRFYQGVLGLKANPTKENWLHGGDGFSVHLMPSKLPVGVVNPSRHAALAVTSLEGVVGRLLEHELRPYQLSEKGDQRFDIVSPNSDLSRGIGTVFVEDFEGFTIEFVQHERGIFAEHSDGR